MKKLKAFGTLFVSLVLGLAVTAYAVEWVERQAAVASTAVVVAAVDLEPGTRLQASQLTRTDWPTHALPSGTVSEVSALQDRVTRSSIQRGEALLESKLAPVGTQGGLSAVITSGKRAMTVRVNDVVGVAGFALPGNYVDVMVNAQQQRDGDSDTSRQISKTVLEQVLVLAVAQESSRDDTKPKLVNAVTLELTPAEAEKIDLARNVGNLSLVLRNQVDHASIPTTGMTRRELFGSEEKIASKSRASARPAYPSPQLKPATSVPNAGAPESALPLRTDAAAQPHCVEVVQAGTRTTSCF
jgi:pilus assembly protein CpaB